VAERDQVARHFQVNVTTASSEQAQALAQLAVEQRLAACAQVSGPISSTYWWEGRVASSEEWLCVLKTSAARLPALLAAVREAHPYDTPEIVATPIAEGDPDYLAWLDAETTGEV
jgi:periplasmic divalent cation tolerance protein